ncbi:MAG TPA: G5 domain-containing protein, partial [Anaerolineae bacterium]
MATVLLYLLAFFVLAACAPTPKRVVLVVDGTRRIVDTHAVTVQDVLREQQVTVGDNDRVEPPLYAEVDRSVTITITRVQVRTDSARQPIPFERQVVRDETYPEGQMRILQLGSNGEVEITYAITSEDGNEMPPRETARKVIRQPQSE